GFRIDLSPEQTEAFDEDAVRRGRAPTKIADEQIAELVRRDARYRRSALLRRFALAKAHKPKLLSANFSVRMGDYRAVNGFDTEYVGWGAEDDDLGRRLYRAGVRPVVGVKEAIVYHQWHATRAPSAWHENAGAARFAMRLPVRCVRGLENPLEQPTPRVLGLVGAPATIVSGGAGGEIRGASGRQ
ncbi:MAG: galactosyltransferase-related protein, partial [Planctomycetota bacterium]